jgi:AraC-like DNA-binding protein
MPESFKITTRERLPGVDLIQIEDSARVWGHLNAAFAFGSMRTWRGQLEYRRRVHALGPGETFLFDPGELFRGAPSPESVGSFQVLEVRPSLLEELCRSEGARAPVHFASAVLKAPRALSSALARLSRAVLAAEDALTLQSRLVQLLHTALTDVLEHNPHPTRRLPPLGPCERLRELLHSSEATSINLSEFARAEDVSQFQLLRTFKRRYGSPPHAYGLHVRVERARELLRRGLSVAEAAAATDFTDQSHFTRHFRRIWGMTPGAYAAACV